MGWYDQEEFEAKAGEVDDALRWGATGITLPDGARLDEGALAAAQLSWSRHEQPRGWLRRLFRRPAPVHPWLHLELRGTDGLRLRVSARARAEDVAGLPVMMRPGARVDLEALFALYATARSLGASLTTWDRRASGDAAIHDAPPPPAPLVTRPEAPPSRAVETDFGSGPVGDAEHSTEGAPEVLEVGQTWDLETLPHQRTGSTRLRHGDSISDIALSPDSAVIVSSGGDDSVRAWDFESGQELDRAFDGSNGSSYAVVYAPDGSRWASSGTGRRVVLREHGSCQTLDTLELPVNGANALAFSPDSRMLAAANSGYGVLWTRLDDDARCVLIGPEGSEGEHLGGSVEAVCFSSDGAYVFFAVNGLGVVAYRVRDSKRVLELTHDTSTSWRIWRDLSVRDDDRHLLAAGPTLFAHTLGRLDTRSPRSEVLTSRPEKTVYRVHHLPGDTDTFITVGHRGLLRYPEGGREGENLCPRSLGVSAVSQDGRYAVAADAQRFIHRIDLQSGEPMTVPDGLERLMSRVAVTPDGTHLFTNDGRGGLHTWNPGETRHNDYDARDTANTRHLAFHAPDTLLSVSWTQVRRYDWDGRRATPRDVWSRSGDYYINDARLLRHGEARIFAACSDGAVRVYTAGGELLGERQLDIGKLQALAFPTPDNLVVLGEGVVVSLEPEALKRRWRHDAARLVSLCPSPDGALLIAGGWGRFLSLDPRTGRRLQFFCRSRYQASWRQAWTGDGKYLITLVPAHCDLTIWRREGLALRCAHFLHSRGVSPVDLAIEGDSDTVHVVMSDTTFLRLRISELVAPD